MSSFLQTIPDTIEGASAYNGRGLFTTVARAKGESLCTLTGTVIAHNDDYDLLSSTECNALDDHRILLLPTLTSYYLINHSTDPNLTIDVKTYELRTKINIEKGAELLLEDLENGFPQAYLRTDRCAYLR